MLQLEQGRLSRCADVPAGRVAIDLGYEPLDAEVLSERNQLGRNGTLHVAVVLDSSGALRANEAIPPVAGQLNQALPVRPMICFPSALNLTL